MSHQTDERRYHKGDEPVDGYLLIKYLGSGNYGEVWKARSAGGVDVALKIQYKIDRKAGRKAFRGLQRIKNINNPHLVSTTSFWLKDEHGNILDDDVADGFANESSNFPPAKRDGTDPRTTMDPDDFGEDPVRETPGSVSRPAELIIQMDLADETMWDCMERYSLAGKPGIPRDELLYYMEGAAKGLDYLNAQHKIYHGDVKPQNLMLTGGEGLVSDFDLAKNLGDTRATTSTAGSTAYVAPEVLQTGQPAATSDQYALAISYFELRTGKLPYATDDNAQVAITAKVTGNLEISALPKRERKAFAKATSLDPAKRYPNCADFVRAVKGGPVPSWHKYVPIAAAALLAITVALVVWAYSTRQTPEETILAALNAVGDDADARTCEDGLRDAAKQVPDLPTDASEEVQGEFTRVLNLLLERSGELLVRPNSDAGDPGEYYRTAIGYVDDEYASKDKETPPDIPVADNDALLVRALVGRARDLTSDSLGRVLTSDELKPIVAGTTSILQTVNSVMDGSKDVKKSLDAPDQIRLAAVRCLAADMQGSQPLDLEILEPLAQLKQLTPAPETSPSLSGKEQNRITELIANIYEESTNPDRYEELKKSLQTNKLVAIITDGDSKFFEFVSDAKKDISNWMNDPSGTHLEQASNHLRAAFAKKADLRRGSELVDQIDELDRIVKLAQSLESPQPAVEAVAIFPTVLGSDTVAHMGISHPLYQSLMQRAEREVLGTLSLRPDQLLDLTAVDKFMPKAGTSASEMGLTEDQFNAICAHWAGLKAADAVHNTEPSYEVLLKLCDAFLNAAPSTEAQSDLHNIVFLCWAECKAALNPNDALPALNDTEIDKVQRVLPSILDGPEKFRSYGHFGQAISQFYDASEEHLVPAVEDLIAKLKTDKMRQLLKLRKERQRLVSRVVMRAARAQTSKETSSGTRNRKFLDSPFRLNGAKAAYEFLKCCRDELKQTNDVAISKLLAQAAFFRDPPEGPDYELATELTDELIQPPDVEPELLVINAQARARGTDNGIDNVRKVLRSYGRFMEVWRQYSKDSKSVKWRMPDDQKFWDLVATEALAYLDRSDDWTKIKNIASAELSSWQALSDSDKQLCGDVARVVAARARALRKNPVLDRNLDIHTQKTHALAQFKLAHKLAPDNIAYIIDWALAYLAIPNLPKDRLIEFTQLAKLVKAVDKEHAGRYILDGRCKIMKAHLTNDRVSRHGLLVEANTDYDHACERADSNDEFRWNALVGKTDARVQLANAIHNDNSNEKRNIQDLLDEAIKAADEALNLPFERSATLLAKANAVEDLGLLVKMTEKYRVALLLFSDAIKAAQGNNNNLVEARAQLGFSRCLYRLLLEKQDDTTPPLDNKRPKPLDLNAAVETLKEAAKAAKKSPSVLADIFLYQARICALIATRSQSHDEVLKRLEEADVCLRECVEQARIASRPEASLWQLEQIQNAYNVWLVLWNTNDLENARLQQGRWLEKIKSLTKELMDTLLTSELPVDGVVPRNNGEILLANIKVLLDLNLDWDVLSPTIDRFLDARIDADLKIHLNLLRAQELFEAVDLDNADPDSWPTEQLKIHRDLNAAEAMLDQLSPADVALWGARIKGQRALIDWKTFMLGATSDKNTQLAASASKSLRRAIAALTAAGPQYGRSDAICLRYKLGELTLKLFQNSSTQGNSRKQVEDTAINALKEIKLDDWRARQFQLRSDRPPHVEWDWGSLEQRGVIFDKNGIEANYEKRVLRLIIKIMES